MSEAEWEQQPNESSKAFHAFTHYRDAPVHHRSIEFASSAHRTDCLDEDQAGTHPIPSQWKRWSAQHSWVERAVAYDRHCDALLRAANERATIDAPVRWAECARFVQERAYAAFEKRDLSEESIRELRLLISEGVRMEREAYSFEAGRVVEDPSSGIRAFLDAVSPSPEAVAALFSEFEDDLVSHEDPAE